MQNILLEIIYIFSGIIIIFTGITALKDKNNPSPIGTFIFWLCLGSIFIAGSYIPKYIIGILLIIMSLLTLFKQVAPSQLTDSSSEYKIQQSTKFGKLIFIPALTIGIVAIIFSSIPSIGGIAGLGIGAFIALLITLFLFKEKPQNIAHEGARLLHNIGSTLILPQLLGALGAIFAAVGVGNIVAEIMSSIIPIGNPLVGVTLYCVSLALFTVIMGNAFAAFAVITAGIGLPFVINIGGNPAVVGALGLTAGYCGTLITPMGANFNIVPASILEMQNKYYIIKTQLPFAMVLLILHIILMYILAF